MKLLFTTLKKTLFWSYERGSWQYDVMCVLILAFVFLAPNRFFYSTDADMKRPRIITSEELGTRKANQEEISKYLSKTDGHAVEISRIETVTDNDSGKTEYHVYEK
jgi:uncharacterized membrane protein YfhO